MNGILLINKPKDFTSHDVVAKMRGILRTKKIGHAGTLDPMATGVLPLFIGVATKAVDLIPNQTKCYRAVFRLGISTDTQDITGEIVREAPVTVGEKEINKALDSFRGDIMQVPPMYSAVQIDGKRLYQLARQGKVIDRPARPVTIFSLELVAVKGNDYTIDVHCSSGTYIRTLCQDIGDMVGVGATLTELVRTKAGVYPLGACMTIEEAEEKRNAGLIEEALLSVESVFMPLKEFTLTAKDATLFYNGVRMSLGQFSLPADDTRYRIYAPNNIFLGIGTADREKNMLQQEKLLAREVTW